MPRASRSLRKAASRVTGARGFFSGKQPQQPLEPGPEKPTSGAPSEDDDAAEPLPAMPASVAGASSKDSEWGYFDTPASDDAEMATPTPVPVRKDSECQTDNEGLPRALAVTAAAIDVWPIEPPPRRRELGCCGGLLFRQ